MDIVEMRALLVRSHRENYGWALSCCAHNAPEAEDVLQTVYLKVLDGKARYGGRATFKTWLFSVIRNTAAEERRRTAKRTLLPLKYSQNTDLVTDEDSGDEACTSHIHAVRSTLTALPKRQREVLQLVFYHDLSLQEAAEVMGVSVGSARTHYDRGKKRLRQWLEESRVVHD